MQNDNNHICVKKNSHKNVAIYLRECQVINLILYHIIYMYFGHASVEDCCQKVTFGVRLMLVCLICLFDLILTSHQQSFS